MIQIDIRYTVLKYNFTMNHIFKNMYLNHKLNVVKRYYYIH